MHQDDQSTEKRAWRAPEIVDVGGVLDLTEGQDDNLRDPYSDPPSFNKGASRSGEDEVDLGGR